MKFLSSEWLKAATNDLDIIKEIIHLKHLTHMVAFHAQQAVEKTFKAFLEEKEIETPKIHNLIRIYNLLAEYIDKEYNLNLLKTLDELYIDSRYPGDLGLLPNGNPSINEAKKLFKFALMVYEDISLKLIEEF